VAGNLHQHTTRQGGVDFHGPTNFTGVAAGSIDTVNYQARPLPPIDARHQLRPPVTGFVGRAEDIQALAAALRGATGGAAAISSVRGMGGVGKTELAYAVAADIAADFPDAQLVLDLLGASAAPMTPVTALQSLIRSLIGDPARDLPQDLTALQGAYRSQLAGKRALILADNAADAAQVRPLLPPSGCALLVTSRHHFTLPGMTALTLGALSAPEAEALLLQRCPRIAADAPALAKLCAYLPLALQVSGGLLLNSPGWGIREYVKALEGRRLDLLKDPDAEPDDPQLSVEASLRLSYDALAPALQTVLAQLSVFPAPFKVADAEQL
jgi:hypothetical protein